MNTVETTKVSETEFECAALVAQGAFEADRFEAEDAASWTPEDAYQQAINDVKALLFGDN